MKIILIADGRSPITGHWIECVRSIGHQVWLVSSYPCARPENVEGFYVLPAAFAKYAGNQSRSASAPKEQNGKKGFVKRFRNLFMKGRYLLGPLTLIYYRGSLERIVRKINPDLVHALRIPFEGMLACELPGRYPLMVSIWGNDLTLHAEGSFLMRKLTRRTLQRANALAADAGRDLRLAKEWGYDPRKPVLEVPGNGGIPFTDIRLIAERPVYWLPADHHIVINPRGFRPGSVRNDTFFKSIPLILSRVPNTVFICPSMENQPEALEWIQKLQIPTRNIVLLPTLKQEDLWPLFNKAEVTCTVSQHDGTPNSLLEAMSIGCFPVAGDIESMREWITPGVNGMLVDPDNEKQMAEAVITALQNPDLRSQAAEINQSLILKRAERSAVSAAVGIFYQQTAG